MWKFGRPWLHFAAGSPVFGADDRVPGGGSGDPLEAELVGKTPAQIVQIMKDREGRLRAELTPPPPRTPPVEPPQPTNTEFWNDPNASVDRKIAAKAMTKEEFERVRLSIGPSMIWAAVSMVKEKYKDFHRVEAKVREIMAKIPEWQHTDPNMWETVFIQARGLEHDRLAAEDRAAPLITSERVNLGGTPPPMPDDLTKVTFPGLRPDQTAAGVCEHLGVTHDQYRKAAKELDGDGRLPLTVDNRRSK